MDTRTTQMERTNTDEKEKGEIGFTLSTRKISADNQKDRVKDKFHVGSIKNE